MKKGNLYTVLFMITISAFFSLILASADSVLAPQILRNEDLALKSAIVEVLGINGDNDDIDQVFNTRVQLNNINDIEYYQGNNKSGETQSYAVKFSGSGLWGEITGYLGIDASFDKLTGVYFLSHNETPGLGGRIDESWFKGQFISVPVQSNKSISYDDDEVDAVTGATNTSRIVLNLINNTVQDFLEVMEGES